jgi:UDPglucose--hexose-1-phosphate uridylyltransferase
MSEIRQNVVTGEWVVVAPERAGRPADHAAKDPARKPVPEYVPECPFCPGNEDQTPPQVLCLPSDGPWRVRVVPNKYPALTRRHRIAKGGDGTHPALDGVGWHEVVVMSRRHSADPASLSDEAMARTLIAFKMRGLEMARDPLVEQIVYLINHGPGAGTSRTHPHGQIVALPLVPARAQARIEAARRFFDASGACATCQTWRAEWEGGGRAVSQSPRFVAFVPYAASSPYETWIVPKRHGAGFRYAGADELADLGGLLRIVLRKIRRGLNDPDLNVVIQSAPVGWGGSAFLHWRVVVTPRLVPWGGFELGTGMCINPALPEENARLLRSVKA